MLVDETGMPLFFFALFITTQVRNAGRSANIIGAYLSTIKRLYIWSRASAIDLEQRFSTKVYLTDSELESLCSSVGRRIRFRSVVPKGLLDSRGSGPQAIDQGSHRCQR
ncbi:hypothetical protein [Dyella acidisoli]|uniref:hypothetical protein n=1 Tax=Dyella acidisoli TaxID=1867834 RepID=UPI0024E10078|nr:hypothetical protein [Dyella acidisoli]